MAPKIKVVWITEFSNEKIRAKLHFKPNVFESFVKLIHGENVTVSHSDLGQWITNGIEEFKSFGDVELHVIAPFNYLNTSVARFEIEGIKYYFINNEFRSTKEMILRKINNNHYCQYNKNSKRISDIILRINPDIIHLIGAENAHYALSILKIPHKFPIITQLQTFVNDQDFKRNYILNENVYKQKADAEIKVLRRSDYVGNKASKYVKLVHEVIDKDKVVLNTTLALSEPINLNPCKKDFDFVYFSKELEKAGDWAVEAFCLLTKQKPNETLLMVGEYNFSIYNKLVDRLRIFGVEGNVTFAGKQKTHDDVIKLVRKARFAVLPLKIDYISGTIREAMANGIPVVTTITPGTPMLNEIRESVILSEKGDYSAMAKNMFLLMEDESFVNKISQNAAITVKEILNNTTEMRHWVDIYRAIIANKRENLPIPDNFLSKE